MRRGFLLIALLATAGCGGRGDRAGAQERPGANRQARPVLVVQPRPTAWTRELVLDGTLAATDRVQLAARVEGPVERLDVDLGDRVEAGQVLARIAPLDLRARLVELDATLGQARADLTRSEALRQRDLAPEQSVEAARTKVRTTEAQRAVLARQLGDTAVRAPFAGAVSARLVSRGAYARVGTPLLELVTVDPLRLVLSVPERQAGEVTIGTVVEVFAPGAEKVIAPITRVAPDVDPATRTFRVEAEVPATNGALRAGMFVTAHVSLGAIEGAMRVPRASVLTVLGRTRVILVVEGNATPRDVEIVGEEGDDAIVTGLDAQASVVSRGAATLAPGMPVRVEPATPEAAAP